MCRCYALSFSHSSPGARRVCAEANFEAPDMMKKLGATPTVRELLTHRMCEQKKMTLVLCCGVLGVYYKIEITGTEALHTHYNRGHQNPLQRLGAREHLYDVLCRVLCKNLDPRLSGIIL